MSKALRFLSLILCVALLCGLTSAHAEMVTVGISLTGLIPQTDGTFRTVIPEGSFRVYQNGREAGVIAAGRDTLTVNNTDRIRIEPLPQSFSPDWDLSTAYLTPDVTGSGLVMIPVTIYAQGTEVPVYTAAPTAEPVQETPAPELIPETEAPTAEPVQETEAPTDVPVTAVPVTREPTAAPTDTPALTETPEPAPEPTAAAVMNTQAPTPTLPPYTPAETATPEPLLPVFAGSGGTGSLRINVFYDRNSNGYQTSNEKGVRDITVYLLDEAGEPLMTAVTASDGSAVFENLPAGKYRTRVNLADDWYFTPYGGENDLIYSAYGLTNEGSQTSGTVDVRVGEEAVQGIGIHGDAIVLKGFCWLEENIDGLYKDNESKIPGIRIKLESSESDQLEYETVTDAEGNWKIAHLHSGQYYISAVAPDGLMLTRFTQEKGIRSFITSDNRHRQFLADIQSSMNIGFNWASRVYGRCYLDANYNGLYDEGELPLAGVKISAKYTYDGALVSSTVSGEDGTYLLDGLRGRSYTITAILPKGDYIFTRTLPENPLGNRFYSRTDQRSYDLGNFVMTDTEKREMNIGAIIPGSVSGKVYYDDNFSATADAREKSVVKFQVTLLDAQGNTAAVTKTNNTGVYTFTGIKPGEYSLEVNAVNKYAFTKLGSGNVILNRNNGAGYSEKFRVELGEDRTGMDIGMILPGTVKGTVFADRNDNGVRDAGEEGLTGTTVRLMSETEGEAFRAEIGQDGSFLFDAVMPGRYYVEYELPESGVFARQAKGGNEIQGTGTVARTESFDFVTGDVRQAPLCGALTLGRIEGTAYQDHDGNGRMENEEALSGMTVRLIPSREDLEEMTIVTGADGAFLLDRLHPDVYRLQFDCPEGYVMSRTDYLSIPLKAGIREQEITLDLRMGDEWTGQKTGAVIPAAVSGQLWLDENNNGLFDEGERTPAGYTIVVTDDATGQVFDTPVTDGEGRFSAAGMIPGSFTVSLAMDERMQAPKTGDSVFREMNGALVVSGIVLKENEHWDGLLLGMVRTSSVSGHAWIDRGEVIESLPGMKIVMKDTNGSILAETETDAAGNYRIDNLLPCSFRLEVTAPEGCVVIEPDDPRLTGALRSAPLLTSNRIGVTPDTELRMDAEISNIDIGCVLPGRLGDYCWVDLNGDGLQAGDEPGIPNVRIELLRDGAVVAETVTNQYGFYRFVDLYPAAYTLKVYAPSEVKPTRRRTDLKMIASVLQETDDEIAYSIPIIVESNLTEYNADLGFVCRKAGVLPAGTGEGETQVWTPKFRGE